LILVVVVCGCLGSAAGDASALKTRLKVHETCGYELLPDNGVVLTSTLTLTNARGGRAASVRYRAGWNVGQLYPKADAELIVRVAPGRSVRRSATRKLLNAPALWRALREAEEIVCASTKVYTIE
jgi:hypothetical protein